MTRLYWGFAAIAVGLLVACSPAADDEPDPTSTPVVELPTAEPSGLMEEVARDGGTTIRIGVLPIIDAVPFYAAEEDGLFKEAGLHVEIIPFQSALERNVAIQTGEIDAQLADLISTGLLNKDERTITIVKTLYRANDERAMISLIAGKDTGITSPADLAGREVAISHNSLIEYHLDKYLDEAGVARDDVDKIEVSSIPARMTMLSEGQIDAAVLPEPLTTLAVMGGGTIILEDKVSRLGMSVLAFRNDFLEEHGELVRSLLEVHDKAINRINADPASYQHLLSEQARLPDVLNETFAVPPFPATDVPTETEIAQAYAWLVEKDLAPEALPYEQVVDKSFLPVLPEDDY